MAWIGQPVYFFDYVETDDDFIRRPAIVQDFSGPQDPEHRDVDLGYVRRSNGTPVRRNNIPNVETAVVDSNGRVVESYWARRFTGWRGRSHPKKTEVPVVSQAIVYCRWVETDSAHESLAALCRAINTGGEHPRINLLRIESDGSRTTVPDVRSYERVGETDLDGSDFWVWQHSRRGDWGTKGPRS